MSSRAPSDKICHSSGLRVRPFVNAIGSQFCQLCIQQSAYPVIKITKKYEKL